MPKQVMDTLLTGIKRHISAQYGTNDRYLTLDGICEKFNVSRQTANNAVKLLVQEGIVTSARGQGIRVTGRTGTAEMKDRKIICIAKTIDDPLIHEAYYTGIRIAAARVGIETDYVEYDPVDTKSLMFAEYLAGLDADGLIMLNFHLSILPCYYCMQQGRDIIGNVEIPELPTLPVLKDDDAAHAGTIATSIAERDYKEALLVTYGPPEDDYWRRYVKVRLRTLQRALEDRGIRTIPANLSDTGDNSAANKFIRHMAPYRAAVSLESTANRPLAAKFVEYETAVKNGSLMFYTDYAPVFRYPGITGVKVSGPSYEELGEKLAERLIGKWRDGTWGGALQALI